MRDPPSAMLFTRFQVMATDPFYIRILEKLGLNTNRIRWKLYRLQQRSQNMARGGLLPSWLRWIQYPHKICRHCGAVADREARVCPKCKGRLPSMTGYRLHRLLGLMLPAEAPVTNTLFLSVMILIFGLELAMGGFGSGFLTGPPREVLHSLGAWTAQWAVADGQFWRFLSFGLIHAGIIHMGFNGYALSLIGPLVEAQIGRSRMLVLITATQIAAGVASYIWYFQLRGNPAVLTVGASGWLFGLIGFGAAHFHRLGATGKMHRDFFIKWAIAGILFGLVIGFANNAAHVGGLLAGILLGLLPEGTRRAPLPTHLWTIAAWLSLALWLATLLLMARSVL